MRLETFFEKFELFADAPDAVGKLRELVLQLALNGSLIGLDSKCWEHVSLGSLGMWGSGGTPFRSEPRYYGGSVPWLVIGDLNEGVVTSASTFITEEGLLNSSAQLLPKGVLLIAMYGSIGKLGITGIECATNQAIAFCKPDLKRVDLQYLFYTMKGIKAALLARGQGLAQKNISQTILKAWEIYLPPLAEQKRIVAKVDELMALCDRLEAQQKEREDKYTALVRASLARFSAAPIPENLQFLFHKSYDIPPAELRKTILTLAVRGKLVPQDPKDEPAEVGLNKIAAHKAALAKEGKLRGSTTVKSMADDEEEYILPSNWLWVRFGDIMINRDGERIPVSKEERETKAKRYDYYGASGVIDKIDSYLFDKPLLLIGEDGANLINRSTPIAFIARGKYWVNNHAHVLDGISEDFLQFIELYVNAINLEKYVTGSAQPKMNQAKMNSIPIALPPLAEQRRIVTKVNHLMSLVDELETRLSASRAAGEKLLEALVAELTNGA